MANHTVRVTLSDDEEKFIKWLAKRDKVTVQEEMQMCFYTDLRQLQDLYSEEMRVESEDN